GRGNLRRDDSFGNAGADLVAAAAVLLLDRIGNEGCDGGTGAGYRAQYRAEKGAANEGCTQFPQFTQGWETGLGAGPLRRRLDVQTLPELDQDFAKSVHADQNHHIGHAVGQDRRVEGKSLGPVSAVGADG